MVLIYDQRTKYARCLLNPSKRWIFLRWLRHCGSLARQQARRTGEILPQTQMSKSGVDFAGTFDGAVETLVEVTNRFAFLTAAPTASKCAATPVVLRPVAPGKKKGRSYGRPAFPIT